MVHALEQKHFNSWLRLKIQETEEQNHCFSYRTYKMIQTMAMTTMRKLARLNISKLKHLPLERPCHHSCKPQC